MTGGASSKTGIKEIASRAGVSIGTVDRVLHNRGEVKKETHDRVMRIVNEMGYTPNLMAKALSSKKMATFAVVIPDSSDNNPYWLKPVEGIELAQRELAAYNARFSTFNYNATNSESFCKALTMTIESEPDGVLVCPAFKEPAIEFCRQLDEKNIPYVFIDINIYLYFIRIDSSNFTKKHLQF